MKKTLSKLIVMIIFSAAMYAVFAATTYKEIDGVVVIEAEHFTTKTGVWNVVDAPTGKALFLVKKRGNIVSYDITFSQKGTYYLWGFGKPADRKADDLLLWWNRVPNTEKSDNTGYKNGGRDFEFNLNAPHNDPARQTWKWTNRAKDKTNQWSGKAHVVVDNPGKYTLYMMTGHEPEIAKGSEAEHYESDVTKRFFGFDKYVFNKNSNSQPSGNGPSATYDKGGGKTNIRIHKSLFNVNRNYVRTDNASGFKLFDVNGRSFDVNNTQTPVSAANVIITNRQLQIKIK